MTDTHRALRAAVAAEAEKSPIRVQLMRPHHDIGEVLAGSLVNLLLGGVMLMCGFRAAHQLWPVIPAAGYVDCVFLHVGLQAFGWAVGLLRAGFTR